MNESRDIHPLVAVWLTKNGYSYVHEYRMPDFGRVDFYATHSDGHVLLVEAKGNLNATKAIFQVLSYGLQLENVRLSIAIPSSQKTERLINLTKKYGVEIIELDITTLAITEIEMTPDLLLGEFSMRMKYLFIFGSTPIHKSHPDYNRAMNAAIFNTATDCCEEVGKNLGLDLAIILVAFELMKAFEELEISNPSQSQIIDWLLQDTTNGEFHELFNFG